MKAVCKREEFAKALDIAARIASRHHTLPILSTIRIEAVGNILELRATNLEVGFIVAVPATIEEEGVVAVPAQTLLQTVTLIQTPTITFTTDADVLRVDADRSKSRLKTYGADDFPNITYPEGKTISIDGKSFAHGLKSVAFAASQSSIKPELGALYIHQKKQNTLTLVATDSFRLAEKTIGITGVALEQGFLVPQKNALEIARTIESLNESPTLTVTTGQMGVSFPGGAKIISRLIEGTFPDYEQIIPKEYQANATFLLKDFEHALRKTNVFANKFMQVSFSLVPLEHTLTLRAENADAGATEEIVRADASGAALTLSFNQHYVVESLTHMASDSIDAKFGGIGRPLVMMGHEDMSFRYLVMPMNK